MYIYIYKYIYIYQISKEQNSNKKNHTDDTTRIINDDKSPNNAQKTNNLFGRYCLAFKSQYRPTHLPRCQGALPLVLRLALGFVGAQLQALQLDLRPSRTDHAMRMSAM